MLRLAQTGIFRNSGLFDGKLIRRTPVHERNPKAEGVCAGNGWSRAWRQYSREADAPSRARPACYYAGKLIRASLELPVVGEHLLAPRPCGWSTQVEQWDAYVKRPGPRPRVTGLAKRRWARSDRPLRWSRRQDTVLLRGDGESGVPFATDTIAGDCPGFVHVRRGAGAKR
jgi:hypothetical protein